METLKSRLNTLTSSLTPPPPPKSLSTDTYIPSLLRNNLPALGSGVVCGCFGGGVIGGVVFKRPKVGIMFGSGLACGVFYSRVNEEIKKFWKE
ncbi:hypothetical protein TrVE_jg3969 [Triparma verrucosa]|uniref:MICOS complex subunit MIC10 n=1 Tax=Triparma verrucosa TaxID=1606542 RepID=A0A9W7EM67_9STRA|nr:hypothetical protein TrVE_jg3969 [Triparma verrucosa]